MRAEGILLWAAVAAYVAAFVLALAGLVFRRPRLETVGRAAFAGAAALHLGAGVARWVAAGHAPVQGAYENSLSAGWFVSVIFLIVMWWLPGTRRAVPVVAALVLLLLGNGITAHSGAVPLEPPFKSGWLVLHVTFAWIAFGAYLIASVLAGVYLVLARRPSGERKPELYDEAAGRLIMFGFVADTVMIASGALWAHGLWGQYWGWDPIETWSLVSWLIYGVNLHLRFTLGWKGKRAAWLALVSVAAVIVTFFGIRFISDVHTKLL